MHLSNYPAETQASSVPSPKTLGLRCVQNGPAVRAGLAVGGRIPPLYTPVFLLSLWDSINVERDVTDLACAGQPPAEDTRTNDKEAKLFSAGPLLVALFSRDAHQIQQFG